MTSGCPYGFGETFCVGGVIMIIVGVLKIAPGVLASILAHRLRMMEPPGPQSDDAPFTSTKRVVAIAKPLYWISWPSMLTIGGILTIAATHRMACGDMAALSSNRESRANKFKLSLASAVISFVEAGALIGISIEFQLHPDAFIPYDDWWDNHESYATGGAFMILVGVLLKVPSGVLASILAHRLRMMHGDDICASCAC